MHAFLRGMGLFLLIVGLLVAVVAASWAIRDESFFLAASRRMSQTVPIPRR